MVPTDHRDQTIAQALGTKKKPLSFLRLLQIDILHYPFFILRGGAIGVIGFDGSFNHAIMIRTFLSHNNRLIFQAGAGIVSKSKSESELQEVNNKVEALRKALVMAEKI